MSRLSRIILGYLVSFLFIVIPAKAQKEAEVYNVDSSLYAYYQRCQEHLLEPVVLSMSDTLFRMASGQNDQRMQAVALSTWTIIITRPIMKTASFFIPIR